MLYSPKLGGIVQKMKSQSSVSSISGNPNAVSLEATAFIGAVSALAIFFLLVFVYVNKKWKLVHVGLGSGGSTTGSNLRVPVSASTLNDKKSSETSTPSPAQKWKTISKKCLEEESKHNNNNAQNGNSCYASSQSSKGALNGIKEELTRRLKEACSNSLKDEDRISRVSSSNSTQNESIITLTSRDGSTPTGSGAHSRCSSTMMTPRCDPYPCASTTGHFKDHAGPPLLLTKSNQSHTRPPLVSQKNFDLSRTDSPRLTSSQSHNTMSRPLRIGTLDEARFGNCSSRRRFNSKMSRSKTEGGRDLMSLAEKGKINGGSSASSTSSNISEDNDPSNPNHSNFQSNYIQRLALQRQIFRTTRSQTLPVESTSTKNQFNDSSDTPSRAMLTHPNVRRSIMPSRTTSLDSESPPPSEQGMSAYTDSLTGDDHIFEVENMSVGDSDLALMDDATLNRITSCPVDPGTLEIAFDYEEQPKKLTLHVIQARGVPPKDMGGATNTQVRVVLLPNRRQKFKTKLRSGQNPSFMESFVFNKITSEDVNNSAIRVRLYGCEKMRRERLLGEAHLSLNSCQIGSGSTQWINLEPRSHVPWDARSETESITRSESASSTASVSGVIPEVLIGLAYNGTTGRLTCEVIKGSHFRNLAGGKAPDSYVKLTLLSNSGQEIGRAKTSLRRSQSNPLFKETFLFQVALFQVLEVTLLVSLYGRKGVTRRELLGWCALGYNSSGDEETTHWEDMCDAQGDQLCRWHVLQA